MMICRSTCSFLGRPTMISEKTSIPKPEAIDDAYLQVDQLMCEQPSSTFSQCSWYIENLKLYDILRMIHFTLYNNAHSSKNEKLGFQEQLRSDIKNVLDLDMQMQDFQKSMPFLLNWDSPNDGSIARGLLRQRLLLKARYVKFS